MHMARTAYAPTLGAVRTPRSAEYDVVAHVTRRLRRAIGEGDFPGTVAALHDNRRLWIGLAADAALPDNPLPDQLRAQIVYLAEFTTLHSSKVMKGEASADILVEINTSVMRGLESGGAGR